jgi:alpha-glucosidase
VNPDYKTVNVAAEERNPNSMLNYYKTLIRLRKQNPAFRGGEFILVDPENNSVLSYLRKAKDGTTVLVTLNFTAEPQTVGLDLKPQGIEGKHMRTLVASFDKNHPSDPGHISLPPYGSYVGEVVH